MKVSRSDYRFALELKATQGLYPKHNIFIQLMGRKYGFDWMQGEDLITHLGLEYYD